MFGDLSLLKLLPHLPEANELIISLEPSNTIWHKTVSTLAQVMACCLTPPSHHMNQCWLTISEAQWQLPEGNYTRDTWAINYWNWLENHLSNISFNSPGAEELYISHAGMLKLCKIWDHIRSSKYKEITGSLEWNVNPLCANFSEGTETYIYILCNFSIMIWHR